MHTFFISILALSMLCQQSVLIGSHEDRVPRVLEIRAGRPVIAADIIVNPEIGRETLARVSRERLVRLACGAIEVIPPIKYIGQATEIIFCSEVLSSLVVNAAQYHFPDTPIDLQLMHKIGVNIWQTEEIIEALQDYYSEKYDYDQTFRRVSATMAVRMLSNFTFDTFLKQAGKGYLVKIVALIGGCKIISFTLPKIDTSCRAYAIRRFNEEYDRLMRDIEIEERNKAVALLYKSQWNAARIVRNEEDMESKARSLHKAAKFFGVNPKDVQVGVIKIDETTANCSICFDDESPMFEENAITLSCNHRYHQTCWDEYLAHNRGNQMPCALCRAIPRSDQ